MSQRLLQDQQQLLVRYKAREMRIVMMMVMIVLLVEDGEVREGKGESEVAAGPATTPRQVQSQRGENDDDDGRS